MKGPAPRPVADRLWAKVKKSEGCWLWTGGQNGRGYGVIFAPNMGRRMMLVHRVSYELAYGPIPAGMQVDHECHNEDLDCPGGPQCPHRLCARPDHLTLATNRDNSLKGRGSNPGRIQAAKTHCPQGHPYDAENTIRHGRDRKWRSCRACAKSAKKRWRAREGPRS